MLASALVLFALAVYGFAALREVRNALMAAGRSRLNSFSACLRKPFPPETLIETINALAVR